MYLLFVDESGTHGGSPVFIVGGIAVHEQDAWHLQARIEGALADALPDSRAARQLELHGSEIRSPKQGKTPWADYPFEVRARVIHKALEAVVEYDPVDSSASPALFGAVVQRTYADYEERAYEELLHRFEGMLARRGYESGKELHERGLVIHDRRVVERDIQSQTQMWRRASGRIGRRLQYLADVPLFADSRASRLLQAADLVCYGLWRYYGLPFPKGEYAQRLWGKFDEADGVIHGLTHVWQGFGSGEPCCPPCESRRGA